LPPMRLVWGLWSRSPVLKVNMSFFCLLFKLIYFNFITQHLIYLKLFFLLFFPFLFIGFSQSCVHSCELTWIDLDFFFYCYRVSLSSWPKLLVSKVDVNWLFCSFFKLIYFFHPLFNLLEIDFCIFFIGLSLSYTHSYKVNGLTRVYSYIFFIVF
jgi:hypothetical protein